MRRKAAGLARQYSSVALDVPRQTGKTTRDRSLRAAYFDLGQTSDRIRLDLQRDSVLQSKVPVTLNDGQVWPEVFPSRT